MMLQLKREWLNPTKNLKFYPWTLSFRYWEDVGRKTHMRIFYPESAELVWKEMEALQVSRKNATNSSLFEVPDDCLYSCQAHEPDDFKYVLLGSPNLTVWERQAIGKDVKHWRKV